MSKSNFNNINLFKLANELQNNSKNTKNMTKHFNKRDALARIREVTRGMQMTMALVEQERKQGVLSRNRLKFYSQGLNKLQKEYESLRNIRNSK